jgi:hypothetical protein
VPIGRVSILLGHQRVRITERHYAPWVRSRQEQLEADLVLAWSRDPFLVMAETDRSAAGDEGRISGKEVYAGYTANTPLLTDSFYSGILWRRGWESNPQVLLRTRKLLILRSTITTKRRTIGRFRQTYGRRKSAWRLPFLLRIVARVRE